MTLFDQKRRQNEEIMNALKQKNMMEQYRNNQVAMGLSPSISLSSALLNKADTASSLSNTANLANTGSAISNAVNANIAGKSAESAISNAIASKMAGQGAGSALKGAIGKAAPIVGGLLSAKAAYDDVKEGDYVGAGLNAVSGVASFVPGVGTAVALGADALNAAKDIVAGNKGKAMAAPMNALKQNEANTINNLNETKANIAQQQQENQSAIQNALANQNMQSPMATMPSNNVLNSVGTNTPTLLQTPVLEYPTASPADNTGLVSDIMSGIKDMGNTVKSNVPTMVNNALEKTKTGLGDFAEGFRDNRNTSFMEGDVYNQITDKSQSPITTDENGALQGGVEETKKSIMNRLGEAAGTTARTISNPAVQGLIAGLLYKATGGDTGESLNYGVNWGMNKARSDNYAKQMGKQPNIWGTYTEGDYKNYTDNQNKLADRELSERKFAHDKLKEDVLQGYKERDLAEKTRHNKAMEERWAKNQDEDWIVEDIEMYNDISKRLNETRKALFNEYKRNNPKATQEEVWNVLNETYSSIDNYADDETKEIILDFMMRRGLSPVEIEKMFGAK